MMLGYGQLAKRASKAATRALSSRSDGRSPTTLLSRWHKLAERELSLLEEEAHRFLPALPTLPLSALSWMARAGEREFMDSVAGEASEASGKRVKQPPAPSDEPGSAYSSYSFSYSAILDNGGERVLASSKRRRYEDSTGILKASHERAVGGGAKKLTETWTRSAADEKAPQRKTALEGCESAAEFEQLWRQTAFADDQAPGGETERRDAFGYGSSPPAPELQGEAGSRPFGADVDAAKAAPEKLHSAVSVGVTPEARAKSREDAIAEGSRTQEEETTPRT